jgi:hypothetical protein
VQQTIVCQTENFTNVNPGGHLEASDTMATWVIGLSRSAMLPKISNDIKITINDSMYIDHISYIHVSSKWFFF